MWLLFKRWFFKWINSLFYKVFYKITFRNLIQYLVTHSAFGFGWEKLARCVGYILFGLQIPLIPFPSPLCATGAWPFGLHLPQYLSGGIRWAWSMGATGGAQIVSEGKRKQEWSISSPVSPFFMSLAMALSLCDHSPRGQLLLHATGSHWAPITLSIQA